MKKILLLLIAIVGVAVAFYFLRPLFVDDVVNEELPTSIEQVTLEEFDSSFTLPTSDEIAALTEEEREALELEMIEKAEKMQVSVNESMEADSSENFPETVLSGRFQDADSFHKGSGNAKIIRLSENQTIARLENFSVTNGPDLFVYLTTHPNPQSSSDVQEGFVNLGRLKGNKGNQNYAIPSDLDLNQFNSIVIYCKAFSVLFSPASLF